MTYIGRFAPSPTGPLHLGSLLAAVGSYLDARAAGGHWLLRVEDLDPPREMPGASAGILRTLESLGFEWQGPVLYQSTRLPAYAEATARLAAAGDAFPCACTRSEIADSAVHGLEGPVYPGTCRAGLAPGRVGRALRLRVPEETLCFDDGLQGRVCQALARDIGDFIVRRADGCYAYQLAVVVDDGWQGVTHVVRGADLLLSTPRQILLQRRLGLPTPGYRHLPVLMNASGEKLSKQTQAAPVDSLPGPEALWRSLGLLRQAPPEALRRASIREIWDWAVAHWSLSSLEGIKSAGTD